MYTYNGNYPLVGIFLPEKTNTNERIPFKYRMLEDETQFFQVNNGLIDSGFVLSIVTPNKFEYKNDSRIIIEGVRYSISSITARIPDKASGSTIRRTINAEYIMVLK